LAAIPAHANPAADEIGQYGGMDQVDRDVWFLAGTLGGKPVKRKCSIPAGRAILFPVINYEMNSLEKPQLRTESELVGHVQQDQDDIINLDAIVDGENVPIYRVKSDPTFFAITAPEDNVVLIPDGGTTQATADGYWVFLKPLHLGEHDIHFSGSCSAGIRKVNARYHITVS